MGTLKMMSLIIAQVVMIGFSSTALAGKWTNDQVIKMDFSATDINPNEVDIRFYVNCNYNKKYIDIIEGRIGERTVSCGSREEKLKVTNGEIVIRGVEHFNKNSKSKDLSLYSLGIQMRHKGNILFDVYAFQEAGIKTFMNNPYNLTFKQFELKDLEITYQGINLIDHPDFSGKETPVTTYFYVKDSLKKNAPDTNFRISFKWFYTPYSHINRNDMSKLGKISIAKAYHAFVNDEVGELQVDVGAKNKENQFVGRELITIPFTQEAIDSLKVVELTTIK